MLKSFRYIILAVPAFIVLILLAWMVPGVRTRVQLWSAEIQYLLNPPEQAVFIPSEGQQLVDFYVTATLQAHLKTPVPADQSASATPTAGGPTPTPTNSPTATHSPTPLPDAASISGVGYQTQRGLWNYCGPSTLAMAISFWGDKVLREEVGNVLRGGDPKDRVDDKNVMPYEKENYVLEHTGLRMIVRSGGRLEQLKALIAAGYPVVIEKHDTLQDIGWVGHYLLLTGYDEASRTFNSMDAYHGPDTRYTYQAVEEAWRAFNFLFYVVYPPEDESAVASILGPYYNQEWATQRALDIALQETGTLTGLDLFYAWYNTGTSYVQQFDYGPASAAFDTAFAVYGSLPEGERPWRMIWYQTGPYFAYYYTGRYIDVLNLANQTLEAMSKPILEESFYWRGLAKEALGDTPGAVADLTTSVTLNPNFEPGWSELARLQP